MKNNSWLVTTSSILSYKIIFYAAKDFKMFIGDAKFALVPCDFKSGTHQDFATPLNPLEYDNLFN